MAKKSWDTLSVDEKLDFLNAELEGLGAYSTATRNATNGIARLVDGIKKDLVSIQKRVVALEKLQKAD